MVLKGLLGRFRRSLGGMDPVTDQPAHVVKSDEEWRQQLTPAEYRVLRQAGTEAPFVGEYTDTKTKGVYRCRACGAELFRSDTKFDSHCGWPSFFTPLAGDAVIERTDDAMGMKRIEVLCANCHSHLGHVFEGEGYGTPTDQRYCINSISLTPGARRELSAITAERDQGRRRPAREVAASSTRGPVKNGISSRTCRRASVAAGRASGRRCGAARRPRRRGSTRSRPGRTTGTVLARTSG